MSIDVYKSKKSKSIFSAFLDFNINTSWRMTPHSLWDTRAFAIYDILARSLITDPDVNVIADVGGGRTWHFGSDFKSTKPHGKLIGIDIDANELSLNPALDQAVATDICLSLGVPDQTLDLVLSRATVEHLHDTQAFLSNVFRALRPGGRAILVFAGPYSPPILINRLIGNHLANKLLRTFVPGTEGYGGFRAHYDKCSYSAFKSAAENAGFEVSYEYSSYYSSSYFQFFVPLHFISIILDYTRQILSVRDLASMNLFVLKKPSL